MTLHWDYLFQAAICACLAVLVASMLRATQHNGEPPWAGISPIAISAEETPQLFRLCLVACGAASLLFLFGSLDFLLEFLGILN